MHFLKYSLTILLTLIIWSALSQTQDTIFFMNGDILGCEIVDDSQIEVEYNFTKRKKSKRKGTHKSEIFATIKGGEKTIYYAKNAIVGDDLSVEEVEIFLAGQRDARNNYKTHAIFGSGVALGIFAGVFGKSGFISIASPLILYPTFQFIPVIRIKEHTMSSPDYKYSEIYADGYERVARGKRVVAAVKSSALGTFIGSMFYRLVIRE